MIPLLALLFAACAEARTFSFEVPHAGEVVAAVTMSSAGADWQEAGREAAVARLQMQGRPEHHVILYAGPRRHEYAAGLGRFEPGRYSIQIDRDEKHSAPGAQLEVHDAKFRVDASADAVLANAPWLYARADTIGKFSDVPLLMYSETLENGVLQYTAVFSNEDGGTSTRALMARWGRTTDIEYIYRMAPGGKATVQGRDHKELPFAGKLEGAHPLLTPVTLNNMVEGNAPTPMRFQLVPRRVDLRERSREHVMRGDPVLYEVMRKELIREGKLRPFGTVDGQKISDPLNYLFVEYLPSVKQARVAVWARRKGEDRWYSSHLGRVDYAIDRNEWVQTTVELPPGTKREQIAEIAFECIAAPQDKGTAHSGECRIERLGSVFLMSQDEIRVSPPPLQIPTGVKIAVAIATSL